MATRDDDSRPPTGSGVHRTVRPRETSTATRTVVEVSVELERMRGEMRQMGSAIREIKEDTERGLKDAADRSSEVRDRLSMMERSSSAASAASTASMDAMRTTLTSSITSMADTLSEFTSFQREDRAMLTRTIEDDRERARLREEREEDRKNEAHALVVQREEDARKDAAAMVARKDQWLQRFWERFKQPMIMIAVAAATVVATMLTKCGGG